MSPPALDVALVMCVRDGARFIEEALASAMAQTQPPREFVVVDDGSKDDSAARAQAMAAHVHVIRQPPRGVGPSRNRGFAACSAPWIAMLDADDRWLPHKLEQQAAAIASTPGAVAVGGRVRQFFDPALGRHDKPEPELLDGPIPSALLVHRDAMEATGGFPEDTSVPDFGAWWLRFRDLALRVAPLDTVVVERRLHDSNLGVADPQAKARYVRMVKQLLDARRRGDSA